LGIGHATWTFPSEGAPGGEWANPGRRRPRYTAQTSERTGPRNLQRSRTRRRGYEAPRVRQKVQVGTGRRALSPDLHRLPPSPSLFREDVVLRSVERPTPVPLAPRGTADRPRECREGAVERRLLAVEALEIRDRESRGRPAAPSAAVAYASSACQATASMMGCQFFSHLIPISLASSGLGCGCCVTSLCKRPPHYLRSSAPSIQIRSLSTACWSSKGTETRWIFVARLNDSFERHRKALDSVAGLTTL